MAFGGRLGEVVQTSGEMTFEWSIRDFSSLPSEVGDFSYSPAFDFADSTWYLTLYPNGEKIEKKSLVGWIGLYLRREDSKPCNRTVFFTFGIKCSGVNKEREEFEHVFPPNVPGHGFSRFWSRSEVLNKELGLLLNDMLTITCHLKCWDTDPAKVSLSKRLGKVSCDMKTILDSGRRSDFTLKLGDREWPVHKVILESRCKYFENMFSHDWVESTVGEVKFDDMDEKALDSVLQFIYTGVVKDMSGEDACEIYVAARRFLLDDLRALCVEYVKGSMSVGIVCKALLLAHTYGEEDLKERATEFYFQEYEKVFETEEWEELGKNNWSIVSVLLKEATKRSKK